MASVLRDVRPTLESEADAYEFLERLRWGDDGPTECPHCGSTKGAWYLKPKDPAGRKAKGGSSTRSQRRVWKCSENRCRRQFSVLTNTVMHATKLPVRAWIDTIFDLCESPSGTSARTIAARWGVTTKSAWAMLERIETALRESSAKDIFTAGPPRWIDDLAASSPPDSGAESRFVSGRDPGSVEAASAVEKPVGSVLDEAVSGSDSTVVEGAEPGPQEAASVVEEPVEAVVEGVEPGPREADSGSDVDREFGPVEADSGGDATVVDAAEPASVGVDDDSASDDARPSLSREDRVRGDVERLLAEAFGNGSETLEPVATSPDTTRVDHDTSTSVGLAGDAAEASSTDAPEGPEDPNRAAATPDSASSKRQGERAGARKKDSAKARERRRKRRRKQKSQPVENSMTERSKGRSARPEIRPADDARDADMRSSTQGVQRDGEADSTLAPELGGGWLSESSPASKSDRSRAMKTVEEGNDEAPAGENDATGSALLGPSWVGAEDGVGRTSGESKPVARDGKNND